MPTYLGTCLEVSRYPIKYYPLHKTRVAFQGVVDSTVSKLCMNLQDEGNRKMNEMKNSEFLQILIPASYRKPLVCITHMRVFPRYLQVETYSRHTTYRAGRDLERVNGMRLGDRDQVLPSPRRSKPVQLTYRSAQAKLQLSPKLQINQTVMEFIAPCDPKPSLAS